MINKPPIFSSSFTFIVVFHGSRILFVIEPGIGHFHPLVPIIRTLQARGHAVAWATSQLSQDRAEQEGIAFYALGLRYSGELLAEFYPWRWTLNHNRRRVGLPSHANPMSPNVIDPNLLLHLCGREFDYNCQYLPPQIQYVGPSLWDLGEKFRPPHSLSELPTDRTLLYATLGTVFHKRVQVFEG